MNESLLDETRVMWRWRDISCYSVIFTKASLNTPFPSLARLHHANRHQLPALPSAGVVGERLFPGGGLIFAGKRQ